MELFFRTRDAGVGNDYPNISWMPPLPEGAERKWTRFGSLQNQTYPQLVLSAKRGAWSLYLEGLNSGRNDALSGAGGRIIRNSLYLVGNSTEAAEAYSVLAAYVNDLTPTRLTSTKDPQKTFRDAMAAIVAPGTPRTAKNGGVGTQGKLAEALLRAIIEDARKRGAPPVDGVDVAAKVVCGLSRKGRGEFLAVCRSLMDGRRDGCAVALSTARLADASRIEALAGEPLIGLLSLDERDAATDSGGDFPPRLNDNILQPKEPEDNGWDAPIIDGDAEKGKKPGNVVVGGAAVVSVVLLLLILRWIFGGSDKPDSSGRKKVSANFPTQVVTNGVPHGSSIK